MPKRISPDESMHKKYLTGVCPFSDDCFTCSKPDCVANSGLAYRINILPADIERGNALKGGK